MAHLPISLIITVLNERKTLKQLLEALRQQTVLPHETIVIDGGSSDGTYELLQELQASYRTLNLQIAQLPGNRSRGRNEAIRRAKHQLIAITDAGCIPHTDWLQKLRQKATDYQLKYNVLSGLVVAGYYDARPTTPFEETVVPYVLVMPDRVDPSNFLPATRSMLLHTNVWSAVNGFDEQLSDNEDYDFARRIQLLARTQNQSGYEVPIEIVFAEDAKVTWIPRSTLGTFARMIYRFARGDAQAGLWRPKVGLVFARYVVASLLVVAGIMLSLPWLLVTVSLAGVLYLGWSIKKNLRYVKRGWYWLPVLQLVADVEVIRGSLVGALKRSLG